MSRNDESRAPGLTPSGWHDDAVRNRDAGHDEMQAAIWRLWSGDKPPHSVIERDGKNYRLHAVYVEFPIRMREHGHWNRGPYHTGRLRSFSDVAIEWVSIESDKDKEWRANNPGHQYEPTMYYWFFELKPRIYSAGAVIRQCTSLGDVARGAEYKSEIFALVYEDDPKAALLDELSPHPVIMIGRHNKEALP